jgi:gamma-glutamylputrescine oxidase
MPALPSLLQDLECDVCIVGGGVTGVSAALHLAEAGLRVVLLEAQKIGWAASGRNGGVMTPYSELDYAPLEKALSAEHARQYWQLADRALDTLHSTVQRLNIDCEIKTGSLTAANTPAQYERLRNNFDTLQRQNGLQDAHVLSATEVRDYLGTDIYAGGLFYKRLPALHPLKLVRGLARAALSAGAQLFENSAVASYEDNGAQVRVLTQAGHVVHSKSLLLATNAYLGDLQPDLAKRFVALYSNMIATAPLSEDLARQVLKHDVSVLETQAVMRYYRLSADNRLLFGGGGVMTGRDGRVVRPLLTRMLRDLFPQLRDVQVEHAWGGWFGMTLFGDTPDVGRLSQRVHYAQAIPVVWAVLHGKLLAEALTDDSRAYDILASIDIPPGPGGRRLSLAIHQAGNLIASVRGMFLRG